MPEKAEVFRDRYDAVRRIREADQRAAAMQQLADRSIGALEDLEERTIELHNAIEQVQQLWTDADALVTETRGGNRYRDLSVKLQNLLEDVL